MSLAWPELHNAPLLGIIEQGEGRQTEFKRLVHSPRKIAKSIVAFANTEGGKILIGVDDDGRITGIHSEKEMLEILLEALRLHVAPEVAIETEVVEYKHRFILVVTVPKSPQNPHWHVADNKKTLYVREGSSNRGVTSYTL